METTWSVLLVAVMSETIDFSTFMDEWNTIEDQTANETQRTFAAVLDHSAPERKIDGSSGAGRTYTTALSIAWNLYRDPAWSVLWVAADRPHVDDAQAKIDDMLARHPGCVGVVAGDRVSLTASFNVVKKSRVFLLILDVWGSNLGDVMRKRREQLPTIPIMGSQFPVFSQIVWVERDASEVEL